MKGTMTSSREMPPCATTSSPAIRERLQITSQIVHAEQGASRNSATESSPETVLQLRLGTLAGRTLWLVCPWSQPAHLLSDSQFRSPSHSHDRQSDKRQTLLAVDDREAVADGLVMPTGAPRMHACGLHGHSVHHVVDLVPNQPETDSRGLARAASNLGSAGLSRLVTSSTPDR